MKGLPNPWLGDDWKLDDIESLRAFMELTGRLSEHGIKMLVVCCLRCTLGACSMPVVLSCWPIWGVRRRISGGTFVSLLPRPGILNFPFVRAVARPAAWRWCGRLP